MNTLTQQIEESRERYGLLIAGLDNMEEKRQEAQDNIDRIVNEILGTSSSKGIYEFYFTLFSVLKLVAPQSTLEGSSTPPSSLSVKLLGSIKDEGHDVGKVYKGGLASSLFGENEASGASSETNFEINYSSDPFICKTGIVVGGVLASTDFVSRATAIKTSIMTPSEEYYYYTGTDKENIQSLTDEVKNWANTGFNPSSISTLQQDTIDHLNSVLESSSDNSFWNIPDLSSIISEMNSLNGVNKDWTALDSANQVLQETGNVSSMISSDLPISELNTWIDAIEAITANYTEGLSSLKTAIESALELANSASDITGFRKHWLYWILQLVDRPQSYRMDYNGAVQAITSLSKQVTSIKGAVELVTSDNKILPTPELNAFYKDPSTNEYVAVFTTIPCYDFVNLFIGTEKLSYTYGVDVVNNSEVRVNRDFIDPSLDIYLSIERSNLECSDNSNIIHAPEAIS